MNKYLDLYANTTIKYTGNQCVLIHFLNATIRMHHLFFSLLMLLLLLFICFISLSETTTLHYVHNVFAGVCVCGREREMEIKVGL